MIKNNLLDFSIPLWLKEIFLGILLVIIPFIFLMKDNSSTADLTSLYIIYIAAFTGAFFLIIILVSKIISMIWQKVLNKKIRMLIPALSMGYVFQFYYRYFSDFIDSHIATQKDEFSLIQVIILDVGMALFFEAVCLIIIIAIVRYAHISNRFLTILATLTIGYTVIAYGENVVSSDVLNQNLMPIEHEFVQSEINKSSSNIPNIYYIILDGMEAIDTSVSAGTITNEEANDIYHQIEEKGLRYIHNARSDYPMTAFSVQSMLTLEHVKKNYRHHQYPLLLYSYGNEVPVLSYLKQKDIPFYWAASFHIPCMDIFTDAFYCYVDEKQDSSIKRKILNIGGQFRYIYNATLFREAYVFMSLLARNDDYLPGYTLNNFLKYGLNKKYSNSPYFLFIHHAAPHDPYYLTKDCAYTIDETSYRDMYLCAAETSIKFMDYINEVDPTAIVVITADHGWEADRGSVFSAIKAPESCFSIRGEPRSVLNTMRFIFQCAYGYPLEYLPAADPHTVQMIKKAFYDAKGMTDAKGKP